MTLKIKFLIKEGEAKQVATKCDSQKKSGEEDEINTAPS